MGELLCAFVVRERCGASCGGGIVSMFPVFVSLRVRGCRAVSTRAGRGLSFFMFLSRCTHFCTRTGGGG